MLPQTTARRLFVPALVLLTLSLPVAALPGPPSGESAVASRMPAILTEQRPSLSGAESVLLPPPGPVATVTTKARVAPVAPAAQPAVQGPTSRARAASRSRAGEYRPGWEARRGYTALALISYPWRDLGWDISFHEARPGLLGLAYEPEKHIYIFVRRNQSLRALAFTIAHEIGHAYDFTNSTRESHNRWLELRGIDRMTRWSGCNGCSDFETPAGDFAEVFAVWQVGPVDFRSRMAPLPEGERLRVLSQEFAPSSGASAT